MRFVFSRRCFSRLYFPLSFLDRPKNPVWDSWLGFTEMPVGQTVGLRLKVLSSWLYDLFCVYKVRGRVGGCSMSLVPWRNALLWSRVTPASGKRGGKMGMLTIKRKRKTSDYKGLWLYKRSRKINWIRPVVRFSRQSEIIYRNVCKIILIKATD